jgi:FkbM family methyltransferase
MTTQPVECLVCSGSCRLLDVVDFNKSCEEQRGCFLPLSGTPIYYYSCEVCEFCFAPEFGQWTLADFEAQIYNDNYISVDPDYLSIRPSNNAKALIGAFGAQKDGIRHLDYGGGNGLLTRLLKEAGWNSTSYDPFVDRTTNLDDLGTFNLITAFEVFEHVPNVKSLANNLSSLLEANGMVLFTTLLIDGNINLNKRINWWYASPRNGHISLFSSESLRWFAKQVGLNYHKFTPGLHALLNQVPHWAEQLFNPPAPETSPESKPEAIKTIDSIQPFPPYVEQTMTRYGPMLYPIKDKYVGGSLKEYGQFCIGELDLFTQFISPGAVVLDIGANIGAHTVPLAQLVGPGGVVVAFEPQPVLYQILCANVVLNSIPNVLTYAMALGDCEGECLIPVLDYSQPNNFGGIGMDMVEEGDTVPLGMLDGFQLERVDFIKLDVEGFESKVLEGATNTIERCRPIMYIENDREDKSAELIQRLFNMGYRLWWHTPPLFHPNNFRGNKENVFPGVVSINMLAIHRDMKPIEGLRAILSHEDTWR